MAPAPVAAADAAVTVEAAVAVTVVVTAAAEVAVTAAAIVAGAREAASASRALHVFLSPLAVHCRRTSSSQRLRAVYGS